MSIKPRPFSTEGLEQIRAAGMSLAMDAAPLVGNDPHLAMMALVIAAGHLAAITKTSYEELVKLISDHYEYVLVNEAARELSASGAQVVMLPKPDLKV